MASRLGEAFVTISAKLDKLQSDLRLAQSQTATAIAGMQAKADSLNFSSAASGLGSLSSIAAGVTTALLAMSAAAGIIGTKFNETIESSTVGIAALLSAQGKFSDAQGKELDGREKINAALEYSSDLIKQLQIDNLKTTATFEQLVKAFQVTLAPGLSVGLDVNQVREYTLAMVQAAAAMQIPLDMMAEETRSLLKGTITPRNTLIATALGITPEDIKKLQGDADALFKFIMGKLEAFKTFGGILGETYAGLLSNSKDAMSNILGAATRPFFDDLKVAFRAFYDYAIQVDEVTGKITLNPELINSLQILVDTLRVALATAQALAKALAAVGTAYSAAKTSAITVGQSNAGFSGPEATDLTDTQRLERVKKLMADITAQQQTLSKAKEIGWLRTATEDFNLLSVAMTAVDKSINISALENFRAQMVKAGQDTSQVDVFLQGLKTSTDQAGSAQESAAGKVDKFAYSANQAALSADEFKKKLQELAGVNLDNLTKGLDTKLVELTAKIAIAQSGLKTPYQSAAAEYAKTMSEADSATKAATEQGTDLLQVMGDIISVRNKAVQVYEKETKLADINESNAAARKKGAQPIDYSRIDQDVLRFKERMAKMYQELYGLDMDYEAQRLEASGQFYAAEEVRMAKKVSDQKAAYAKEVADTEQAYIEMQQKLSQAKGATPEAIAAVAALQESWIAAKKRAEEYNATVDRNATQELDLIKQRQTLQGNVDLAQTILSYKELTGTMQEQLAAQIALIKATEAQKLANVDTGIPGLVEAYKKLYAEQIRVAEVMANGSWVDGFMEGAKKLHNTLPTLAQEGLEVFETLKNGIDRAADALAEFTLDGKKNFSDMARSIIKDLLAIQYKKMMLSATDSLFGGGGGGIFSGLTSILGFGGGSSASSSASSSSGFYLNPTQFKADGGEVEQGKPYVVGEKGPEWFVPDTGGSILQYGSMPKFNTTSNLTVSVPITVTSDNKRMISELKSGVEETVTRLIRKYS